MPSYWTTRDDAPALDRAPGHVGAVTRALRRRTMIVHAALCLLGALPAVLAASGWWDASPGWQALGWSLWLPGGGLLALGGWGVLGFVLVFVAFRYSMIVWMMTGMLALPAFLWVGSAGLAWLFAGAGVSGYGPYGVVAAVIAFWLVQRRQRMRDVRTIAADQIARNAYLPRATEELKRTGAAARADLATTARELDVDALRAARCLFDLALQPVGQFAGFTRIDNIQGASLRYQLNWISYGLAQLQNGYTPNFHGYLNAAQRFAIESLARPEVCGYWKYEYAWGKFGWQPDPIGTMDNVMLTGWSLSPLTAYAATTGDLRYQEKGALAFRPFRSSDRAYPHDAGSFVGSITRNFDANALHLYPCEPFWTFPICNIFAMCGLIPYDRINGTTHAEDHYDRFMRHMDEEFIGASGDIATLTSSLTGLHRFSRPNPRLRLSSNASIALKGNAVHPGIARRAYAIMRQEMITVKDGRVSTGAPFEKHVDMGNYTRNPGVSLAAIAQAAGEHGDEEVRIAALATADDLLVREAGDGGTRYVGVSTTANVRMATARWTRANDWHDVIAKGPNAAALAGPILAECRYPDVLVARAVSDGADLELVLYNGGSPGPQPIGIARLRPGADYAVHVAGAEPARCRASADGRLDLAPVLDGRTPVRIVPAAR